MSPLAGIHPVREALRAGRPIEYVLIVKGAGGPRLQELIDLCRDRQIPVRFESREHLDRTSGRTPHQGVIAFGAAEKYASLETTAAAGGLHVILDGVEDPHNLGAIVRTALAAGATGIVIPERRAAGLTDTVERASAGALAHLPIARVTNLVRAMEEMKEAGYWLVGLDERAEKSYTDVDLQDSVGIVLGSEGEGLHELTRKRCDFLVSLPTSGPVRSLNVSVAAGVMLFEVVRQRQGRSSETTK